MVWNRCFAPGSQGEASTSLKTPRLPDDWVSMPRSIFEPQLRPRCPVSNTERQRRFRERNPGYFKRYYKRKCPLQEEAIRIMLARPRVEKPADPVIVVPDPLPQDVAPSGC